MHRCHETKVFPLLFKLFLSIFVNDSCLYTCRSISYFDQSVLHLLHRFQKRDAAVEDRPVTCEAEDSFMCSVALGAESSFDVMVTLSISEARAPSVLLRIPARPGETVGARFVFFPALFDARDVHIYDFD